MHSSQQISVIPFFRFVKIYAILCAELLHLCFRETEIPGDMSRIQHGVFPENIECGMVSIFSDWKDSCHIHQLYILRAFKNPS